MKKDKGWTPIRRGAIYCSPRCGGNCTQEAFRLATAAAEKTAERLGEGWAPCVWENLGWHWSVERNGTPRDRYPYAQVRGHGPRDFEAEICAGLMKGPHAGATRTVIQFWGSGTTPRKALDAAVAVASAAAVMLNKAASYAGGAP